MKWGMEYDASESYFMMVTLNENIIIFDFGASMLKHMNWDAFESRIRFSNQNTFIKF